MKKRVSGALRALRGNRGSGMVVVLIAVFFIVLLGATLLYTTYTGYLVQATEKKGTETFYDASSVLDEITAGVQNVTSEAISNAYTNVLQQYSKLDDPSLTFDDLFKKEMVENRNTLIASLAGGGHQYSAKALYGYVDTANLPSGASFTVNGYDGAAESPDVLSTVSVADGISLQRVQVVYTCKGYETTVTTDICIAMPDFYEYENENTSAGLPDYALVAKAGLTVQSGAAELNGSAYAGKIDVNTGSLHLGGEGTDTVVPGDVKIRDGASTMTQEGTNSLWAQGVTAGNGSTLTLDGRAYIADDLELRRNATVTLNGEYYGFGASGDNSSASSAILANGAGSTLDLSSAKRLFLAGVSFIGSDVNSNLFMSESMTSKADQRLYLVPESAAGGRNPRLMTLPADETARASELATLKNAVNTAGMSAYNASVVPLAYPIGNGGQYVVYLFWAFPNAARANEFFTDAFNRNPTLVSTYVSQYLEVIGEAKSQQTKGYGVSGSGAALTLQDPYAASLVTQAGRYADWYKKLCLTLTTAEPASTATDNPYDYYVDTEKVAASGDVQQNNGNTYRITGGDVTITAANTWDLVIAAGNVTVTGDYQGMILCGGTVTVVSGAKITTSDTAKALLSDAEVSQYLRGYNQHGGGTLPDSRKTWALDELVHYENWSKN